MYEVHFSLAEALESYQQLISDYSVFLYIFLAMIVFGFLLWINRKSSTTFYMTLGFLLLMIVMSFYFQGFGMFSHLDSFFSRYFYKNLYFYYWNMFFVFFLIHRLISSRKMPEVSKVIVIIFFIFLSTNNLFQFYMSDIVGGNYLLVLGNTAPMIIIGNVVSFVLYLYFIVFLIVDIVKKKDN